MDLLINNQTYPLEADPDEPLLWVPLMVESQRNFIAEHMPLCLKNSGGSFWMRRVG